MKRLLNTMFALIFALSVVGVMACDDGDDKDDNNTVQDVVETNDVVADDDVAETPEDTTETPEDTTETPEDTTETPEEVVEATGACTNETDGPLLDTPEKRDAVTAQATTCGIDCLGADDVVVCSVTCVSDATGLTQECAGCYAGMVACSKDNCLAECLAEPGSEACADCQTNAGCFDDFYACSGMTPAAE